jgi:glyoxylase-like metal-dependent hydrolase (beta-lactamase superfamily II)/poly(3-hydroxybutyrate) depolymerase
MKKSILTIAAVLALLGAAIALSQTGTQVNAQRKISPEAAKLEPLFKSGNFKGAGNSLPYRYFEPTAKNTDGAKYPVILYLHGEDEAGTDNKAQLTTTESATVWIEPRHLAEHPVYVLAPQIPRGKDWTMEPVYADTLAVLKQFTTSHPAADTNRIYVVGFSMGATGLWNMLLKNPKLFAAAMPISGSADKYLGDYQAWAALKNTPVIILHSYDDTVVPISAALNAAAALQAGGNEFLGYGAPTPSLWSPGSTASPHDAWYTAFHKFEVIYNSLFWGDLSKTHNGEIDPTTLYTHRELDNGITQVWDYALGTSIVIERADKAVIIDTTMGHIGRDGGIYQYIRDHVLNNKNVDIEVFITHQHDDHIRGLASFVGATQLKKVYVHKEDSGPVRNMLGPDAAKVSLVKDGDLIPLGGKNVEVIGVPGHTLGSIIMKYENNIFSGDSIGTGYVGVGVLSIEEYIQSLQHLLDRMGAGHYAVYGAHTGELIAPMTEQYVHDLLDCARSVANHSIAAPIYWRSAELSTRKVSTVRRSSITYDINNVHPIKGALRALRISQGILGQGYEPQFPAFVEGAPGIRSPRYTGFAAYISNYYTTVDGAVSALDITPTVRDAGYKSLAINGVAVDSGESYHATLNVGKNRLPIVVTASDGTTRTYTLDVIRNAN